MAGRWPKRTRLLRVPVTEDREVEVLVDDLGGTSWSRPYPGGSYSQSRSGHLAHTSLTPLRPAEVTVLEPGRKPRVLTALNEDFLGLRSLGSVEAVTAGSAADGRDILAWFARYSGR